MPLFAAVVAAPEVGVRRVPEQETGQRVAARVVAGVRIALGEAAREIEEAVVVARRDRPRLNVAVLAAELQRLPREVSCVAGLDAGGAIVGPAAVAPNADTGRAAGDVVLVEADARH